MPADPRGLLRVRLQLCGTSVCGGLFASSGAGEASTGVTMEQTVYKIGEVAARLGLVDKNCNTLRSWAEEFGEFLSASANPPHGQPRRFTQRDVQILTAIRDYRAHHLSYDEIRARLHAGEHDVTGPLAEEAPAQGPGTSFAPDGRALVPLAQVETLLAPLAASVEEWRRLAEEYRGRLEAREARIAVLEQRVDELYARLGTVPQGDAPAPTTTTETPTPASGAPGATSPSEAADASTPVAADPTPGVADSTESGGAVPLFPLPVTERTPPPAADVPEVERSAPRRPWWRVWR
jgi:DNA-binding transcriptional MerR regulator